MEIIIYQPINPTFRVDSEKKLYKTSDYKIVFEKEYDSRPNKTDKELLEWIFEMDNLTKNFTTDKGHTLSVGDIVEFRSHKDFLKGSTKYICDSFGWNKIEWVEG